MNWHLCSGRSNQCRQGKSQFLSLEIPQGNVNGRQCQIGRWIHSGNEGIRQIRPKLSQSVRFPLVPLNRCKNHLVYLPLTFANIALSISVTAPTCKMNKTKFSSKFHLV